MNAPKLKTRFLLLMGVLFLCWGVYHMVHLRQVPKHDTPRRHTKPPLARGPQLAAPQPSAQAKVGLLQETQLAPLRRAFRPPQIIADPNIASTRQTLLSQRRIIAPATRAITPTITQPQKPTRRHTTPFIIQLNQPVTETTRALVSARGAIERGYLPHNAILAELSPQTLRAVAQLPEVQAIHEWHPADKLQAFVTHLIQQQAGSAQLKIDIRTFAPEDGEEVAAVVTQLGGSVEGYYRGSRWGRVRAILALNHIPHLATYGAVEWIEERGQVQILNEMAVQPSQMNVMASHENWYLNGQGQVIGHADTGLDTGVASTMHPDLAPRIRALIARARPGDGSDLHAHGTHTAGSLVGTGAASAGLYRGIAWGAELVHQAVADQDDEFSGLGDDIYEVFAEAHAYGATIHSDSWGTPVAGAYDLDCSSADLFMWDHPEMLLVFAAGNSGVDTYPRDGVVDEGSLTSPGAAKNVLTVGATEGERAKGTGGFTSYTWHQLLSKNNWLAPIRDDLISKSADTAHPAHQGMAAFSSRGPTQDNRIKPDVVAPGVNIISTRTLLGNQHWGTLSSNNRYCFNGGTSMATPLTAGCAALVRQYCQERAGLLSPSAPLIKAILAGGSRQIAPGQYGTNQFQEIPYTIPNNVSGWGQVDLTASLHPTAAMIKLWDDIAPAHASTNTFALEIIVPAQPLDVALCWTDFAANPGAGPKLVNDFDLLLEDPQGVFYYPNAQQTPDTLNTLESIHLASAPAGVYQLHVIGSHVVMAGSVAAMYARGAINTAAVIAHQPLTAHSSTEPTIAIDFKVQSLSTYTNHEVVVWWRTDALSAWQAYPATNLSNHTYQATIPTPNAVATLQYYIAITDPLAAHVTLPTNAPSTYFSFVSSPPVALEIMGTPQAHGHVTPAYGTHLTPINQELTLTAPQKVSVALDEQMHCAGWVGSGSVPPSGLTNRVTLWLTEASSITWQWQSEYRLLESFRLLDTGQTFGESITWHAAGTTAATTTAQEWGYVGDEPYAFCGWSVDQTRWPNALDSALNPATNILMDRPHTAQGNYLPFWQDSDQNGISDWWELRYFGDEVAEIAPGDDPDGDGWDNRAEFLDGSDPNNPHSVPLPPTINFTPPASPQTQRPPWRVTATVTDNFSVEEVAFVWRPVGSAHWQYSDMEWETGDLYTIDFMPPDHGSTPIEYYIYATDLLGYYDMSFATTSILHTVMGVYDDPWLELTPHQARELELSNATSNLTWNVANLVGGDLEWTTEILTPQAYLLATNSAWHHSGTNDLWTLTHRRSRDQTPVWYCGDTNGFAYANNSHAILDTPPFNVGAQGALFFRHWLETEYEDGTYYWDGGVVKVSQDGGQTFEVITPVGGYPARIMANPASPFAPNQPCLAGDGNGWESVLLDLSAYTGQTVIIRFEFGSDAYVAAEGWYLSDFTVLSSNTSAPWLQPQAPWGGTLAGGHHTTLTLTADPAACSYDREQVAVLRLSSNDPAPAPLIPITLRRGHHIYLTAHGAGHIEATTTFLFGAVDQATITVTADPWHYLYALIIDSSPQAGIYNYDTTQKVFNVVAPSGDTYIDAYFDIRRYTLDIQSAQGNPFPAVGSTLYPHGQSIGALVLSPVYQDQSTRWRCLGWSLSGHEPHQGTNTWYTFNLTNNATLTWHWQQEFLFTAGAYGHGSVTEASGWYSAGTTVAVSATPDPYFYFVQWNGAIAGALIDGAHYQYTLNAPASVTATFSPCVVEPYGVPYWWLAANGWDNNFHLAATADFDGDGLSAWQEWLAGTDPRDPHSRLAITQIKGDASGVAIEWIGGTNRQQLLQYTSALHLPWQVIYTNQPPMPVTNSLLLPPLTLPGRGFFKVTIP